MNKLDLKKELKHLYQPSAKKIELVNVPAMNFIMIDGAIEPYEKPGSSPLFQENMGALYGAAYTVKFAVKLREQDPFDYPVMPSEGLWWVEDGLFDITEPGNWKYTLMMMQPDQITGEMFADALAQLRKKKGDQPAFARLRMERFEEGLCVQTMHIGPYATEPATLEQMRAFMAENGLRDQVGSAVGPTGNHHEIYLGNPLRAAQEKLKTVLRHPVEAL